jgi:hypothetical protein
MTSREDEEKVVPLTAPEAGPAHRLPYAVELWDLLRERPERVVGRAASMVLARAIFMAAQSEHLGRKIVLRRGAKVLHESD